MPLSLAAAAALSGQAAAGTGNPFTIANFPVEASAQDAVAAKDKAYTEGQQSAFRALLKRLVPVTAYREAARLKSVNAAGLVQGVSVRKEQNSSTQYTANLDFTFDPARVRDILTREGVPFADTQAPLATLIPLFQESSGKKTANTRAAALWNGLWRQLDLENSLTPLKPEGVKPVLDAALLKKLAVDDPEAHRILSGAYEGRPVVVAIATLDASGKRLEVKLHGRDAVGTLTLARSYRVDQGDLAYAMELAAVVALGTLEGRWKAAHTPQRDAGRW